LLHAQTPRLTLLPLHPAAAPPLPAELVLLFEPLVLVTPMMLLLLVVMVLESDSSDSSDDWAADRALRPEHLASLHLLHS